ncbi:MAG: hypothetical protein AAF797_09760, partial [Planctomycetota bacterium]
MRCEVWFGVLALVLCGFGVGSALAETVYQSEDTGGRWTDERVDAARALKALGWRPEGFEVRVKAGDAWWGDAEATVVFDSPKAEGPATQRRVVMRWYKARGAAGRVVDAEEGGEGRVGRPG